MTGRVRTPLAFCVIPLMSALVLASCADPRTKQNPARGATGSTTTASEVTAGPISPDTMPALLGMTRAEAENTLAKTLTSSTDSLLKTIRYEYVDTAAPIDAGTIVAQQPAIGTQLDSSTQIIVRLASGAQASSSPSD